MGTYTNVYCSICDEVTTASVRKWRPRRRNTRQRIANELVSDPKDDLIQGVINGIRRLGSKKRLRCDNCGSMHVKPTT